MAQIIVFRIRIRIDDGYEVYERKFFVRTRMNLCVFFCFRSDSYVRHVCLDMNEGLVMIVKVVCCQEYFTSFLAHYPIPFQLFVSHYDRFQFECSLHFLRSLNDT